MSNLCNKISTEIDNLNTMVPCVGYVQKFANIQNQSVGIQKISRALTFSTKCIDMVNAQDGF